MRPLILAMVFLLSAACGARRLTWQPCLLPTDAGPTEAGDDGGVIPTDPNAANLPDCGAPLTCLTFSAPGPDGQCHGVTAACVLPCMTNADCAALGQNSVCLPSCTQGAPAVCTPFQ